MKRLAVWIACAVFVVAFGALAASMNHETEDAQALADDLAAAPAQAYALAQADAATKRTQHPTTTQPARRRHVSTLPESDQ